METFYLVDFENVNRKGMKGSDALSGTDHVHLFYTENAKKIDLDIISNCGASEFRLHKVPTGNQSLDKHLTSYLGYLIGRNEGQPCSYVIVGDDKGYDDIIDFWKDCSDVPIARQLRISAEEQGEKKERSRKEAASLSTAEDPAAPETTPTKSKAEKSRRRKRGTKNDAAHENGEEIVKPQESGSVEAEKPAEEQVKTAGKKRGRKKKESTEATDRSELLMEVETIMDPYYSENTIRDVQGIIEKHLGEEHWMGNIHNTLLSTYENDADAKEIYNLIKQTLTKYTPKTVKEHVQKAAPVNEKNRLNNEIQKTLSKAKMDGQIVNDVASLVVQCADEKNRKQKVYRTIISQYGQNQGLNIYNQIKNIL